MGDAKQIPKIEIKPRNNSVDHIEPFMLPPSGYIDRLLVGYDMQSLRNEISLINPTVRSRLEEVIDLTDSPKPDVPLRMDFQSPIARMVDQLVQEDETKKSPVSVLDFENLKTNDPIVDMILESGTP